MESTRITASCNGWQNPETMSTGQSDEMSSPSCKNTAKIGFTPEPDNQSANESKEMQFAGFTDNEESVNLNDVVSYILSNRQLDGCQKPKKRRQRLTNEQTQVLEAEFQKNANWSSREIVKMSKRLSLSRSKIYKWNWDRKRKTLESDDIETVMNDDVCMD